MNDDENGTMSTICPLIKISEITNFIVDMNGALIKSNFGTQVT